MTTTWPCCAQLARVFSDKRSVAQLEQAESADDVLAVLQGVSV